MKDGIKTRSEVMFVFQLLVDCLKVLYYRDCRAHFKYQLADITPEGVTIHDDLDLKQETSWEVASFVR